MKKLLLLFPIFIFISACSVGAPKEIAETEDILADKDCDRVDEETKETIHTIADFLHGDSIDSLRKRLNNGVLESRTSLQKEMELVHLHSCTDVTFDDDVTEQRMKTYLQLLEYAYTVMPENKEMKVENLTFKESSFPFLYKLRAEFTDGKQAAVTFYLGPNAYSDYLAEDTKKLKDSLENTPSVSTGVTIDFLRWTTHVLDPVNSAASQLKNYYERKEKRDWEKEYDDEMVLVQRFNMHFARIEGDDDAILYDSKRRKVTLYPTEATYEIFDRLKEVHNLNPEIPYPEKLIHQKKWKKLEDYLSDIPFTVELNDYIFSGTPPRGKSLERVAKDGLEEGES